MSEQSMDKVGTILLSTNRPLKERFRSLFTLRGLGGPKALEYMSKAFYNDPDLNKDALLKHEVAYCLGQMQDSNAIPILCRVLEDKTQPSIVRHEAGEALGALGNYPGIKEILERHYVDRHEVREVRDTCELALRRLEWLEKGSKEPISKNPYQSVDPAPPSLERDIKRLETTLLDTNVSLFERYRALFALRNNGDIESIRSICRGFDTENVLFRHEIAYVLGQIQSPESKVSLLQRLRDSNENPMVRHECAEALGALLSNDDIQAELRTYLNEKEHDLVKESCIIALDFHEYNQSNDFQYADTLSKV